MADTTWVLWGLGLIQALIAILVAGNIYWVKHWMQKREEWETKRDNRIIEFEKAGGVVTGSILRAAFVDHEERCTGVANSQGFGEWREDLYKEGGPMTTERHTSFCKANNVEIKQYIKEESAHTRNEIRSDLIAFKVDQASISKGILDLMREIKERLR